MLRHLCLAAAVLIPAVAPAADWKPVPGPLATRWAKDVSPEKVHGEYPRPQMVRKDWTNLNGLWEYAIVSSEAGQPKEFTGKILVPFPVESSLSGVMKRVGPKEKLWYRRTLDVRKPKDAGRVLLHFGAVDWEAMVWVNGNEVAQHRGGYDPFSCDITDALAADKPSELLVSASDPTDASYQPRGKQIAKPHGIWYTPTTGIWQTVWLEVVPENYISALRITPDLDKSNVIFSVDYQLAAGKTTTLSAKVFAAGEEVPFKHHSSIKDIISNRQISIWPVHIPNPRLWSPDSPFLYDVTFTVAVDGKVVDEVRSYFAMRKISLGKDAQGITRILLNNKPLFQFGPLDQGFWPDGLYTAPTDEALRYDLEVTKKLGFNMVRKHVKVEPARWYHHCDKLGLLVWQDMPSGDKYIGPNDPDSQRTEESTKQFETEWAEIIKDFGNHPCIVMWVPFNEGWGQYDTARIAELTKKLDPTRLVNSASGWTDRKVGDVHDVHIYPGPGMPPLSEKRAAVLGEYGGLGLPLEGHTWQGKDNWGYRSYTNKEDLQRAYLQLTANLRPLIGKGLSAAVYTQTTDVEIEVNGLMTYDRAVLKFDEKQLAAAHARLYLPPPKLTTVVPTSQQEAQKWRYTLAKPADGWEKAGFDDTAWKEGPGGFGEKSTPGSAVRTDWKTPDIWLRRTFELPAGKQEGLYLAIHHDEGAEVYLNGVLAAKTSGYITDYTLVAIDEAALKSLREGKNTLAVHCHQTGGGQYIDVGLVEVVERPATK
ncbi:MAG: glycoside hydrolase family 2 [Pirellulaceae bacterium]|nr:glycoside hydrolase family 2 [Pirellulaceae bacterium]